MRVLIQIVPRRARAPEGVGDYARLLAEELERAHGIETHFIACTPLPPAERADDRWPTLTLERQNARSLLEAIEQIRASHPDAAVLLHHSGYGYQKRGVPLWLTRALHRWRDRDPGARLVTMFHELFATGPVTTSAFWLQGAQRYVARRLLAMSDAVATTTTLFAEHLRHWQQGNLRPILTLPVFSNMGEQDEVTPASRRPNTLVVFGRGSTARAAYHVERATLADFVHAAAITRIIDIGARDEPPPAMIGDAFVEVLGETSVSQVSQVLAAARYGLLSYPVRFVEKSGIFAAYCAHGVVPVCLNAQIPGGNGVLPGRNCLRLPFAPDDPGHWDANPIQAAARDWYEPHRLAETGARLAIVLQS